MREGFMPMLNTLKNWWSGNPDSQTKIPELSLAITKLMVGMMGMDGRIDASERVEINFLLREHYGLTAVEGEALIEQCLSGDAENLRFNEIVEHINSNYDLEQRTRILQQIWQVALADGEIDFLEDQYINRLSGLLGVPVESLVSAKKTIQN
ncbi:MAG: hypothetical protein CO188_01385 [Zetaproteobacteria bacterium CG_4_9_14_3_um_filter_54_145]|nr:MAG: hypothetical protein COZ50_01115 [Zetaproteobacteria bacterium CG_4_10_14_3_um_filter_54_28]PJA30899.1 MAG: hypothetical protein CO188_01385 [Zetaproteobacteria bacterium CG_4_9_14_3_um_filter_54_145]